VHVESDPAVALALRLGWSLAEARGRTWPDGPRPIATPLPETPANALPLRSQRSPDASRHEAVLSLTALAHKVGFADIADFTSGLNTVLPAPDASVGHDRAPVTADEWTVIAKFFHDWDARIQDDLTQRDELVANAYLLGRGLAECYWGLGPDPVLPSEGSATAVSLAFLLGDDRRRELTRMLGRLGPHLSNPLTAPAIAGSLEAWGKVAADADWSRAPELRSWLYEQIRRWYQLLVLEQDPTTLVKPGARLRSTRSVLRLARAFWPQLLLAAISVAMITAFLAITHGSAPDWVKSILATGGVGAFAVAGMVARAQSAAQQLAVRLRQDAYTDLVAVDISDVPPYPSIDHATGLRRTKIVVERAVRERLLTPPTPVPDS
jgi:hypothetical protein